MRVLDVGCGWGASPSTRPTRHGVARHRHHAVRAAGAQARERAARGGRGRPGRHPRAGLPRARRRARSTAIASIGMVEHVGAVNIDAYAAPARDAAGARRAAAQPRHRAPAPRRPGGRAVLGALRVPRRRAAAPLARAARDRARRASRSTTSRASGSTTRRRCATGRARLDDRIDEATRLAGHERVRVWRLYLRAARRGFETGFTSHLPGQGVAAR